MLQTDEDTRMKDLTMDINKLKAIARKLPRNCRSRVAIGKLVYVLIRQQTKLRYGSSNEYNL